MRRFFVDTFYWIALSNRRDQWHARVQAFNRTLDAYRLYTTEEVLAEFLLAYNAELRGFGYHECMPLLIVRLS